jgi:hypothetical protein
MPSPTPAEHEANDASRALDEPAAKVDEKQANYTAAIATLSEATAVKFAELHRRLNHATLMNEHSAAKIDKQQAGYTAATAALNETAAKFAELHKGQLVIAEVLRLQMVANAGLQTANTGLASSLHTLLQTTCDAAACDRSCRPGEPSRAHLIWLNEQTKQECRRERVCTEEAERRERVNATRQSVRIEGLEKGLRIANKILKSMDPPRDDERRREYRAAAAALEVHDAHDFEPLLWPPPPITPPGSP